jgi:hypothetical protein
VIKENQYLHMYLPNLFIIQLIIIIDLILLSCNDLKSRLLEPVLPLFLSVTHPFIGLAQEGDKEKGQKNER